MSSQGSTLNACASRPSTLTLAETLDRAHVAHAKIRPCSQLFLRQILFMAQTTHIDCHDLFEIHA